MVNNFIFACRYLLRRLDQGGRRKHGESVAKRVPFLEKCDSRSKAEDENGKSLAAGPVELANTLTRFEMVHGTMVQLSS